MTHMQAQTKFTQVMIEAASALVLAQARLDRIKPIVIGYQTAVLEKHRFQIAEKWRPYFEPDLSVVLTPAHAHLLGDRDFARYLDECEVAIHAYGLKTERPGLCPLGDAAYQVNKAKKALVAAMAPITMISLDNALDRLNSVEYEKLVAICLGMVDNLMGVRG